MPENQSMQPDRRTLYNYFVKPKIQWPHIMRMLAIVNLCGIFLTATIFIVIYYGFNAESVLDGLEATGATSQGLVNSLVQENLMTVFAPAIVIADVISVIIGLWLSIYFSRKVSLPIHRMKQWAEAVSAGDLTYKLKFRPGDHLQEMEQACNQVTETYALVIEDLKRQITEANIPLSRLSIPVKTRIQKSLP